MTAEITLVLGILGVAIVLFASERLRVDVVSMMVMLTLLFTGLITTNEAFSGFSNPAVITIWAIYVVSDALFRTGIADFIGQRILQVAGSGEGRLIGVLMLTVGTMSAFMNNIGATAVLLPAVVSIGRKVKISPSKLLIPLAFGSLLGGVTTLIGTPPNLLASNALAEAGYEPFSLFDYSPMGIIIMLVSIGYFVLVGRHLLPNRVPPESADLTANYRVRDYLAELRVEEDSPLIGKTIVGTELGEKYDLTIMGLIRDGNTRLGVLPDRHVRPGDIYLVKGNLNNIFQVQPALKITINPQASVGEDNLTSDEAGLAEVVISQRADFVGRSLREIDFRLRYDLTVLAIWRNEAPVDGSLADIPLQFGDLLLVQGLQERIDFLGEEGEFLVLGPVATEKRRTRKAPFALAIFLLMIGLVAIGGVHISAAAVLGAVLMVLSGSLSQDEAYSAIQWKSVFLIAGMLPLGIAMENSGAAQFLADLIIQSLERFGPAGIMIGLFILTTVITEFMSNAAAAVLVAPIAISSAVSLGVDPRAFVMGVGIAASNSFMFPIGHQASILVYGPGGYRFFDYTRVGLPLTILVWVLMIIFLPVFWPL